MTRPSLADRRRRHAGRAVPTGTGSTDPVTEVCRVITLHRHRRSCRPHWSLGQHRPGLPRSRAGSSTRTATGLAVVVPSPTGTGQHDPVTDVSAWASPAAVHRWSCCHHGIGQQRPGDRGLWWGITRTGIAVGSGNHRPADRGRRREPHPHRHRPGWSRRPHRNRAATDPTHRGRRRLRTRTDTAGRRRPPGTGWHRPGHRGPRRLLDPHRRPAWPVVPSAPDRAAPTRSPTSPPALTRHRTPPGGVTTSTG